MNQNIINLGTRAYSYSHVWYWLPPSKTRGSAETYPRELGHGGGLAQQESCWELIRLGAHVSLVSPLLLLTICLTCLSSETTWNVIVKSNVLVEGQRVTKVQLVLHSCLHITMFIKVLNKCFLEDIHCELFFPSVPIWEVGRVGFSPESHMSLYQ